MDYCITIMWTFLELLKYYWSKFTSWFRPATISAGSTISSIDDDEVWTARPGGMAVVGPNMEGGDNMNRKRGGHMVGGFDIGENGKDVEDRSEEHHQTEKEMQEENQVLKTENEGLKQRLRAAEKDSLKGVQSFLTTTDLHSGSEIIAMVESINNEIFQAAAFMAELLESEPETGWWDRGKNIQNYHAPLVEAHQHIGGELFNHINVKYRNLRSHPFPLQCAIQGILTAWYIHKIRSFSMDTFGEHLQGLYSLIRESEVQAISGRWRAITSAQLKTIEGESNVNAIFDMIIALLCTAGWSPLSPQAQKALASAQNKVFTIEKKSTELNKAVKQEVTTTDMEVFLANPGAVFTEEMEDFDTESEGVGNSESGSTGPEKRILCTVGMGLKMTTRKKDGATGSLEDQIHLLLRPKVVLPSVLLDSEKGASGA